MHFRQIITLFFFVFYFNILKMQFFLFSELICIILRIFLHEYTIFAISLLIFFPLSSSSLFPLLQLKLVTFSLQLLFSNSHTHNQIFRPCIVGYMYVYLDLTSWDWVT